MSYTAIASQTLASSASSVTFSSIPGTYRDLVVVTQVQGTSGFVMGFRANGDATASYPYVFASGNGSSTFSNTNASFAYGRLNIGVSGTSTENMECVFQIMDYSVTDKHKPVLARTNNAANGTEMIALRWAKTSAITSLEILNTANQFVAGSTFSLYGIEA